MNFPRLSLGLGFAVLLGMTALTAGFVPAGPASGQALNPTPTASASAGPKRGKRAAGQPGGVDTPPPSATPEPPQFDTLDGIWEVELQPVGRRLANYTHLSVNTTGANIIGYMQKGPKSPKYPMTGTFDGRLISMNVTMPDGATATFNGYVETFADMVGLYRASDKDAGTAFTAEHRKKIKT